MWRRGERSGWAGNEVTGEGDGETSQGGQYSEVLSASVIHRERGRNEAEEVKEIPEDGKVSWDRQNTPVRECRGIVEKGESMKIMDQADMARRRVIGQESSSCENRGDGRIAKTEEFEWVAAAGLRT